MLSHLFIRIFAFTILIFQATSLTIFGRCINPNQQRAICIYLEDCHYLYSALRKTLLSESDRMFLTKSQCGFANGRVLICCPDSYLYAAPFELPLPTAQTFKRSTGLLPTTGQCAGVLTNRIFGGNTTRIDEYPWMARIQYTKSLNRKGYHCGGSLINQRYVLTAAHCVNGANIPSNWRLSAVRLGEWDTQTNPDCEVDVRGQKDCAPKHLDIPVTEAIPHENYLPKSRTQEHDIALLRLAHVVTFTDFVKPICLPLDAHLRYANYDGKVMDVAGWGQTEYEASSSKKLKAGVVGINHEECQNVYSTQNIHLVDTQLCAGGKLGIDSCRGDSGGPLIALDSSHAAKHTYFLAGIVSFGPTPCGLEGWPGVYTKVADYIHWIQDHIRH